MTATDIGVGATVAATMALLVTIIALRFLPPRADASNGGTQAGYLMSQLVVKNEETHSLRVELDQTKAEVGVLKIQIIDRDKRIGALELQVSDLWNMLRQQGVRIDETRAATTAAYNEPRKASVRPVADVTLSEDVPFRDWLVLHFDDADLHTLCGDLKLAAPPGVLKIEDAATHVVRESRKNGKLSALEQVALDKRPHVPAW